MVAESNAGVSASEESVTSDSFAGVAWNTSSLASASGPLEAIVLSISGVSSAFSVKASEAAVFEDFALVPFAEFRTAPGFLMLPALALLAGSIRGFTTLGLRFETSFTSVFSCVLPAELAVARVMRARKLSPASATLDEVLRGAGFDAVELE